MNVAVAILFLMNSALFSSPGYNVGMIATIDETVAADASHVCVVASGFRLTEPGHVRVRWYDLGTSGGIPIAETWLDWHPDILTTVRSCMSLEAFQSENIQATLQDPNVVAGSMWAALRGIRLQLEQQELP